MRADLAKIQKATTEIGVFGLGHVGLPTALCLSDLGWHVIGADSDAEKIAGLQRGECPFYEPALHELLIKHLATGQFAVTSDVEAAIRSVSVMFLCVGTPQTSTGDADLSQIEELARAVARNLSGYKLIIEKSTVPAITGRWIMKTIARYATGTNGNGNEGNRHHPALPIFEVASNPEFLQEGRAVQDFFHPDRIVCGVSSPKARAILEEIYHDIDCPKLFTDITTAELIKHASNAFLATKISFINMVADICDGVGANVVSVAKGMGMDSRIGSSFLNAGLGFGGYCLPKDLRAFIRLGEQNNVDCSLLHAVDALNASRPEHLLRKMHDALWIVRGKTVAVLGLAFKAGTDDIREAPAFSVVRSLISEGACVRLYDPKANATSKQVLPHSGTLTYCKDAYDAASGADAVLVTTEWDDFRNLQLSRLHRVMRIPVIIDGRNLLDPERVRAAGFEYHSIGRSDISHGPEIPIHSKECLATKTRNRFVRSATTGS